MADFLHVVPPNALVTPDCPGKTNNQGTKTDPEVML